MNIQEAIQQLKQEHIVALPTETVYGLACLYNSPKAIKNLYELKGRPADKAMTINLARPEDIDQFLDQKPQGLEELMRAFWPGPLTIVTPVKENLYLPGSKEGMCGFRIPKHPLTQLVLQEVGAVVLPSANLSGMPPAVTAEEVRAVFGDQFPVLDGGACQLGIASTVIIFMQDQWVISRLGSTSQESLKSILHYEPKQLGALLCQN